MAVEPATKLAEIAATGDGYDTLGYVHYMLRNYEEATEAFSNALDRGDLGDPALTNLSYARALVELDRFDDALTATRRSSDLGDESDRRNANSYLRFVETQKARHDALETRKAAVIDFYVSYD